jgi:hypothetical protein
LAEALIGVLLLYLAGAGFWIWLCLGFRKTGLWGVLGKGALQVSGVCFFFGVIQGGLIDAAITAAFPPVFWWSLRWYGHFQPFLSELAWRVAPYGAVALLGALALKQFRGWSVGIAFGAALIAAVFLGDQVSREHMCEAAAKRGFGAFHRNSFAWSLRTAPQEFQFELHAYAETGGQRLGWSYRELDWYELPAGAWGEVSPPMFNCP